MEYYYLHRYIAMFLRLYMCKSTRVYKTTAVYLLSVNDKSF